MNKVRNYTDKQLLERVKKLPSFKQIPNNYWVLGVRSNEDTPNVYDDKFYIFAGEKFITMLTGTTNTGTPILQGGFLKYNKVGGAVVKADECYYNLWLYGLHLGKMKALKQVNNIIVYRDGDKDLKSEEIGKPITGIYGINFHTCNFNELSKAIPSEINNWSAGCQVANNVEKYYQTINLFKNNSFTTYILLNEF
jgi:hypothetical protein